MEYIIAFLAIGLAFWLIGVICRPVSPGNTNADTSRQQYEAKVEKDLEELKDSPFLEPIEAALCQEIDLELGPKHCFTKQIYYLDRAFLRGPCDPKCPMYEWGGIITAFSDLGYDKIFSNTRRDAVTLHLISRLQAKYPQLGIECTKVLEHDKKDPMMLYEHKAISVDYSLVNSSPLKQV